MSGEVATTASDSLPVLIDRAAAALTNARTSAEVLEAREMAGTVYEMARRTARFLKAKQAHDDLVAAAYRVQGDALLIESQAKMRLADEVDAAQDRGEVRQPGRSPNILIGNNCEPASIADLGLRPREVHEARQIRDAEAADPGIVRRTVDDRVAAGQPPTKATLRTAIRDRKAPEPTWTPTDIVASDSHDSIGRSSSSGLTDAWKRLTAPAQKPEPYITGDTAVFHAIEAAWKAIEPLGPAPSALRRYPPQLLHCLSVETLERLAKWFDEAAIEAKLILGGRNVAAE